MPLLRHYANREYRMLLSVVRPGGGQGGIALTGLL